VTFAIDPCHITKRWLSSHDYLNRKLLLNKQASWVIDGFKVEALSGPASVVAGSFMSFATEDESYSGQWRPLFYPAK
jgi:hypothetical protein